MKKTIYTFLLGALLITGCSDDSLDTTPNDRYTEESFWTSEKNASAGLTGCYAVLRDKGIYGGEATPLLEETATPNAYNYNNRMNYNEIARGSHTATNTDIINSRWNASYSGIGRCNALLANIDNVPMDNALKERMKGEARFLRALYYSLLATYYKDAPLVLDEPNIDQALLPRTPHEEIVVQIIKDLDAAALVLPAKYTVVTDLGRATSGAALALKARVLLFEASPLMNPAGELAKWQQAADAAKAVMNLTAAGYGLFPNYRQLFLPANEGRQEAIFDVQFKTPEQGSTFDVVGSQYNDNAPILDLIQAYEMSDGLPQTASPLYNAATPYANRDPRFAQTIVYPGSTFQGTTALTSRFQITGFAIKKYTVYDAASATIIAGGRSETNYMVLRYADVLLMYAEAQNEAVGPDASVYDAVNSIRQRAGLNPYQVPAGKTKEQMREIIRHERRIEFVGEGFYYNDIRRWKTAETVMNTQIFNHASEPVATRTFNAARDYWWPVPQVQRDRNPNLDQNDEYGG
jgi:starch-binding outer membrane protein, SusD/RagB family